MHESVQTEMICRMHLQQQITYRNKPGTTAPNSVAQGESGRLISEISTYRSHDRNVVLLYVFGGVQTVP